MSFEERVLPELRPVLHRLPQMDLERDMPMMRGFKLPPLPKSPDVRISSHTVEGPESPLLLKAYEPVNRPDGRLPAVYWIHGGGYVLGHPDGDDPLCQRIVQGIGCVVFSIDYRLAPEHPYPAAIEDCYAGLLWVEDHAADMGIDASRIAIAGASAGGGLTAALALMARDKGGPQVVFQMPLYPMIDDRNTTLSSHEMNVENLPGAWNRESNMTAWRMYLGDIDDISPYAAAARAEDFSGLPPAYTCVGELDPFRDETIDYVSRLAQAGVPVEFHLYPGCFHGFDAIYNDTETGRRAVREYIDALARGLDV